MVIRLRMAMATTMTTKMKIEDIGLGRDGKEQHGDNNEDDDAGDGVDDACDDGDHEHDDGDKGGGNKYKYNTGLLTP